MSERPVEAKVARLLVEGRVRVFVGSQGLVARVDGDHGSYLVTLTRSLDAICPCSSRLQCSHSLAVERVVKGRA